MTRGYDSAGGRLDSILGTDQHSAACFQTEMANNLRGGFGAAPDMMLMSRSESGSKDTLAAMLASCTPGALQASRSTGSLEDALIGCGQKRSFYPSFDASLDLAGDDDAGDDCTHVEKKRRLTFDQVRSLEKNFELENKLEPERKMQLAKELGLQPRQVAVWFQNRRARWKTKQLERDYEVLTLDYNRLKSELESVIDEKQELEAKVKWLTEKAQPEEEAGCEAGYVQSKVVEKAVNPTSNHSRLKPPKKPSEPSNGRDVDQPSTFPVDNVPSEIRKRKDGSPSSVSTSSEILDADSPRTIDSGLNSLTQQDHHRTVAAACPQICVDATIVNPIVMDLTQDLCGGRVFSPQAYQRTVKLEDGAMVFHEDSCNYLLPQEEDESWWEWA